MKVFNLHRTPLLLLSLCLVWTMSTAWAADEKKSPTSDHSADKAADTGSTETKSTSPGSGNLPTVQGEAKDDDNIIVQSLNRLREKNKGKAEILAGEIAQIDLKGKNFEEKVGEAVNRAFDKDFEPDGQQLEVVRAAVKEALTRRLAAAKSAGVEDKFKKDLARVSKGDTDNDLAQSAAKSTGAAKTKSAEQTAAEEKLAAQEKANQERKKDLDAKEAQLGQALQAAQQQAALQAAAQQAQNNKNNGGGGSGGGSGSGGSGAGGNPSGIGGGNDLPDNKGIGDKLQKHQDNTPSLSQLRNNLPDFSQNNSRGAQSEQKKKEEPQFKVGSDSKKSSENDFASKIKPKKEADDKAKTLADAGVQDAAADLPVSGAAGMNGKLLGGPNSVPQSIPNQYPSSGASFDASLGGGGGGGDGFGGAKVGGGKAGGGGGGEGGGFSFDVGRGEPIAPEPAIKKIFQELISGGGGGEGGEGDDEVDGGGAAASNYTSSRSVKDGTGLLVNQLVLTRDNPKARGLGLMVYTNVLQEMCASEQGKHMAVCEHKGDRKPLSTKK